MSAVRDKEEMGSADVQIWNNAAFDNGEVKEFSGNKASWSPLKPILLDSKESLDWDASSKENEGPLFDNQVLSITSSLKSVATPFKPVNWNGDLESRGIPKSGFEKKVDFKSYDEEIEAIETEISRLTSRLEALKQEKAERNVKTAEKRGRVVHAKFMEPKQSVKIPEEKKEVEKISSRNRIQRKGLSLGPAEIVAGARRGMSMGPSEIFGSAKSRNLGKQEMITPVQPIQSRRKSCFWKLQDIDEGTAGGNGRGKSFSVSPKSRKMAATSRALPRQAVTTDASKKVVKKEDRMMNSVQPKKLFKDSEKSAPAYDKIPLRQGRIVASRYNNQCTNVKTESTRCDKKGSLSVGKSHIEGKSIGTESRAKKRWEIPSEVVLHGTLVESEKSSHSSAVLDLLPRIRISRCTNNSPRDSGPAKRVVELIGKKSYFSINEEVEPSVCQALRFAEEEAEET